MVRDVVGFKLRQYIYVCKLCGKRISSVNRLQALNQALAHVVTHVTTDQGVYQIIDDIVSKYFDRTETFIEL